MTGKAHERHDDVLRNLGDSVVAGGPIALAIAAGAFLMAKLARLLRRA
jgi:cation transporter-like permease